MIDIDQSPIGRTPRSNPATYTGVFDDIRDLFAQTNEAKIRGYKKKAALVSMSRVGVVKLAQEMGSSRLKCTSCRMSLFLVKSAMDVVTIVRHLEVHYKEKNIAEVLDMTVNKAVEFFKHIPKN